MREGFNGLQLAVLSHGGVGGFSHAVHAGVTDSDKTDRVDLAMQITNLQFMLYSILGFRLFGRL